METISSNKIDSNYETVPDLLKHNEELYLVFTETIEEDKKAITSIKCSKLSNRTGIWENLDFKYKKYGVPYWKNAKFLKNNKTIVVFSTLTEKKCGFGEIFFFKLNDFNQWDEPKSTGIMGVLSGSPIVLKQGRIILLVHYKNEYSGFYEQSVYYSDDLIKWTKGEKEIKSNSYNFSDSALVEIGENQLLMIIKESSPNGWDLFKSTSENNGISWTSPVKLPFRGGENPYADLYEDSIVISFSNEVSGITDKPIVLAKVKKDDIMHNHMKSEFQTLITKDDYISDDSKIYGYSSWVKGDNNSILAVQYILKITHGLVCIDKISI